MISLHGIGTVAGRYDGFILDLWGVVHDGHKPFAGALDAMRELRRAKRKVWLLSNAPTRVSAIEEHLAQMGVTAEFYDGIHTSGEETHIALRDTYLQKWGRACIRVGPVYSDSLLAGLDISFTEDPAQANFVMNGGRYGSLPGATAEDYRPLLEVCAARGLPMICANPDRMVHDGDRVTLCPGAMADIYERLDGQVVWLGKPHRAVYRRLLEQMDAPRVLAVGDGMPTDIAGAAGAGLDSVLVTSGIHRNDVATENFFSGFPYKPTFLMEKLSWE